MVGIGRVKRNCGRVSDALTKCDLKSVLANKADVCSLGTRWASSFDQ